MVLYRHECSIKVNEFKLKGTNRVDYTELTTKFPNLNIKENEALANYTYTETGGPADLLFFPETVEEVTAVIDWTVGNDYPLTILGNASNLIVQDGGIRGVTVILTKLNDLRIEKNKIIVQAGMPLLN